MATSTTRRGLAALGGILLALVAIGAVAGFGPLAGPTPPERVTDPREMLARGLQAVLDAEAVHVEVTVQGTLPGSLVGRDERVVTLDGTTASGDARPREAKTRAAIRIPALDAALETASEWDALWTREGPDGPWQRLSVGGVAVEAGVDLNPLTLVDRLRAYLSRPDIAPTVSDVPCPDLAATCRRIVLDAGSDPVALLALMLPEETRATLPEVSTIVTVDAEAATLRPVRVIAGMTGPNGDVNLVVTLVPSRWDDPSIVIEAPVTGS